MNYINDYNEALTEILKASDNIEITKSEIENALLKISNVKIEDKNEMFNSVLNKLSPL